MAQNSKSTTRREPSPGPTLLRLFKNSTLIQTIYKLHIQRSLYRGATPIALTIALSNFIFFYTLQSTKKMSGLISELKYNQVQPQVGTSLWHSTIAGIVNVLLTNPFWVANLRLVNSTNGNKDQDGNTKKTSSQQTLLKSMKEIAQKEGIGQLWSGTRVSLLLVSNPVIQYYFYENVKEELIKRRKLRRPVASGLVNGGGGLKPIEAFVVGAIAKGLATVVTYPLQLAQVLIRLRKNDTDMIKEDVEPAISLSTPSSKNNAPGPQERRQMYNGTLHCMLGLYKGGGIRALYAGMDAKLIQSVLTSALTFLTYEQLLCIVAKSLQVFSKSLGSTS